MCRCGCVACPHPRRGDFFVSAGSVTQDEQCPGNLNFWVFFIFRSVPVSPVVLDLNPPLYKYRRDRSIHLYTCVQRQCAQGSHGHTRCTAGGRSFDKGGGPRLPSLLGTTKGKGPKAPIPWFPTRYVTSCVGQVLLNYIFCFARPNPTIAL